METPISPKVIVSVIVGIVLTAVVSNVSAITPDMLDFLGPWKLFVFGSLITALMGLAAWWKTDPLRITPEQKNAVTDTAGIEASKQTSLAATAIDAPPTVFPAAKVDAALAAPEPVAVTPVFTPPAP
jgi:hypothetical protein